MHMPPSGGVEARTTDLSGCRLGTACRVWAMQRCVCSSAVRSGDSRRRLRLPGGLGDDRPFVSEDSRPGSGQESRSGGGGDVVAIARSPGFWLLMRYAALFGVVLAFAALAYLGLVKGGTDLWFTLPKDPGWLDGSLWWVAVTAGAGVLVGVLRRVFGSRPSWPARSRS